MLCPYQRRTLVRRAKHKISCGTALGRESVLPDDKAGADAVLSARAPGPLRPLLCLLIEKSDKLRRKALDLRRNKFLRCMALRAVCPADRVYFSRKNPVPAKEEGSCQRTSEGRTAEGYTAKEFIPSPSRKMRLDENRERGKLSAEGVCPSFKSR